MKEKIISNVESVPEISVNVSAKTAIETIFTLYKNSDGVPIGMGYDGSIHDLVAELKGLGFNVNGSTVERLYPKAVSYLNNKYPENVPGTEEHKLAYPDYYPVEEVLKEV